LARFARHWSALFSRRRSKRRLRAGQAEQVAVRPAIALLMFHGLESEVVDFAFHAPARDRVARTAAPAAHRLDVLREAKTLLKVAQGSETESVCWLARHSRAPARTESRRMGPLSAVFSKWKEPV
jgi:hypothetical protein